MRRRHQGEQVEPFRRRVHAPEGERVRSLVETWAQANTRHIEWPHLPSEINDRDADVWEPLIAVADRVGGVWPETARKAGVALVAAGKEKEPSLGIRLLADLRTIFEDFNEMSSKMILSRLIEIEESPWGDIRGRQLDERGLAKRLKAYGIKSKTVRIGDATPRGYTRADLFDAWTRYRPPNPAQAKHPQRLQHTKRTMPGMLRMLRSCRVIKADRRRMNGHSTLKRPANDLPPFVDPRRILATPHGGRSCCRLLWRTDGGCLQGPSR